MDARRIIKLWPTRRELAEDVGARERTVDKWFDRNSIPPEWWDRLIAAASERKIPLSLSKLSVARAERFGQARQTRPRRASRDSDNDDTDRDGAAA